MDTLTDRIRTGVIAGAVGLIGVVGASNANAGSISIVPEKSTVEILEQSYFDVMVNTDGTKLFSVSFPITEPTGNLGVQSSQILPNEFWNGYDINMAYPPTGTFNNLNPLVATNTLGNDHIAVLDDYAGVDGPSSTTGKAIARFNFASSVPGVYTIGFDIDGTNFGAYNSATPIHPTRNSATINVVDTPEPASLALLGLGGLALFGRGRRDEKGREVYCVNKAD